MAFNHKVHIARITEYWLYDLYSFVVVFSCPFPHINFFFTVFSLCFLFFRPMTALQNKLERQRITRDYKTIKTNNESEIFFQLTSLFDDASSHLTMTNCIFETEIHSPDITFV